MQSQGKTNAAIAQPKLLGGDANFRYGGSSLTGDKYEICDQAKRAVVSKDKDSIR